ncbi:Panacea domain-containing protein [Flavobacterium phragmitis]|uniref:Antitoxin SocA-like Panacea domain-containing protein n=1 Tax=Flavobacterium phragmitis TaxID=739143 RepID=A0A1I1JW97_9FLAO|nr:hypothetical protein [Flavobacterium phragmitis]SFC52917.1 hypothetical protein SAMN05216297_101146 [Flavobacterium phragmitis]
MANSTEIFKNVVYHLSNRYIEQTKITLDQFNENNDFTILKLIKLHFFVIVINSEKDRELLDINEFWAMPYGPVETNIYSQIRREKNFTEFILSNEKLYFSNNKPNINTLIENKIIDSINLLLELEPRLLFTDAGTLVELTHKWNCWRKNYSLARARNSYSSIIPKEDIINDIKVVNLDLV